MQIGARHRSAFAPRHLILSSRKDRQARKELPVYAKTESSRGGGIAQALPPIVHPGGVTEEPAICAICG